MTEYQFHITIHCPECDDEMLIYGRINPDINVSFVRCDNKECSQRGKVWCVDRFTGRGVLQRSVA